MSAEDRRMVQVQSEIISELNQKINNFEELRREYLQYKVYGEFYRAMQDVIIKSPMLQASWDNFLMQLKMSASKEEMEKLDPICRNNEKSEMPPMHPRAR